LTGGAGNGHAQGKLLGLTWADTNWTTGVIHVRQQAARTKATSLALAVPALVLDQLRTHRMHQAAECLVSESWTDLDLVFPNGFGKPIEKQNQMRCSFRPLLMRAEL
jgi:hypothetical protein